MGGTGDICQLLDYVVGSTSVSKWAWMYNHGYSELCSNTKNAPLSGESRPRVRTHSTQFVDYS